MLSRIFPRQKEEAAKKQLAIASSAVGLVDSANLGAIFAMFLKESTQQFLEKTGKYAMFSLAAAGSVAQAVLSWRQTALDGGKQRSIVRATVNTATAAAIVTAVVGALGYPEVFKLVSPRMFTATLGVKTLFNAASGLYFWGKSSAVKNNQQKKDQFMGIAKDSAVAALSELLATAGVAAVMVFSQTYLAELGLAAAAVGAGYALYKGGIALFSRASSNGYQQLPQEADVPSDDQDLEGQRQRGLSQGARLTQTLQVSPAPNMAVVVHQDDQQHHQQQVSTKTTATPVRVSNASVINEVTKATVGEKTTTHANDDSVQRNFLKKSH